MGSRAGILNRRSTAAIRLLAEKMPGYDPLVALVRIAQKAEEEGDGALAATAHKAVVPYLYPQLKAVELTGEDGKPIQTRNTVKIIFEHADPKPSGS